MNKIKVVVTGAAGFLGSHLVDKLLELADEVVGIDNLSFGKLDNLSNAFLSRKFKFVLGDLRSLKEWPNELKEADVVFHMAANPEVRHGLAFPLEHYEQNLTTTMNVLEAVRQANVKVLVYASSSTVYGDPEKIPTPENHPLRPVSVYGATKAAGEILVETYSRLYGIRALILRYANIVGPRLRHGVIYDFVTKLARDPRKLTILGDGSQRKSYLYVNDAVEATISAFRTLMRLGERVRIYNVGNRDWVTVRDIAMAVTEAMGLDIVTFEYRPGTSDGRGWPGDVKFMLLDITRITKETGWSPRLSSIEAVRKTAKHLVRKLLN